MSCERFFDFEIEILTKQITVKNFVQEGNENFKIELRFLGNKIDEVNKDEEPESSFVLMNGCQDLDLKFKLTNNFGDAKEDFKFNALGDPLLVDLVKTANSKMSSGDSRKSAKELKDKKFENPKIATGSINLLYNLRRFQNTKTKTFHVNLHPPQNSNLEICIQYQIDFVCSPTIDATLAVEIIHLFNWPLEEEANHLNVVFHFPIENMKFKNVLMHKCQNNDFKGLGGVLVSDSLKNEQFEFIPESEQVCYKYENIQTTPGVNFLTKIIQNKENFLVEIRWNKQVYMSIINLEIFNYEGVNEVKFMVPLYQRNKKTIIDLFIFGQELSGFPEEIITAKNKKSKVSIQPVEHEEPMDSELVPFMYKEKHVAIVMKVKIAKPLVLQLSVDELKLILNQAAPYIEDISLQDQIVSSNEAGFKEIIRKLSKKLEEVINQNAELETYQIKIKVKTMIEKGELFDKEELKKVLKCLIGNKLNLNKKTETNHEFKISMIDAFKTLTQEMMKILEDQMLERDREKSQALSRSLRLNQTEEWLLTGLTDKAEHLFHHDLECEPTKEIMVDYSIFLVRTQKYAKAEEIILQLLTMDNDSKFGFYILSYLKLQSGEIEVAILCMEILVKLEPVNKEFWIILMMLYTKTGYKCGIQYCEINIYGTKDVSGDKKILQSFLYPELKTDDDLSNIANRQLRLELFHFVDLTKDFMKAMKSEIHNQFEDYQLQITEKLMKGELDEATRLISALRIDDDNEAIIRIMKGNLNYATGRLWDGIIEYEIAYNLCLGSGESFPQLPTIRCANWYLTESNLLAKARRYFHKCCKTFPTFDGWMGLGAVCYQEMDYKEAEKYFQEANNIDNKSGDNWMYLALTNVHLHRVAKFEKCLLIARNFDVKNLKLVEEAEKFLDL